jgi:oxalate decarboxylase/phosphoglucose isomerase-like protein (cupin superfamily)
MGKPWEMVNLSDIEPVEEEDSYAYYDLSAALGLDQMRANVFRFRPGDKMEYHSHRRQEELFLHLEGAGELVVNGERHPRLSGHPGAPRPVGEATDRQRRPRRARLARHRRARG